jgi:DNA topoisomerase-1
MKWKKLQHNGILFPPEYEKQGITIKVKGETINLDINQEEMIYQWAKKKDTPYAQDKVFQKNFTKDFAKTLDSKFKKISYEDIDFSNAYKIVDKEKDLKEKLEKSSRDNIDIKPRAIHTVNLLKWVECSKIVMSYLKNLKEHSLQLF